MNSNVVMVRYGELSTKGKNIKDFIKKLANNIKDSLKEFTELTYKVQHDHIYINLNGVEFEKVSEKLKLIPGISSFSLVTSIAPDLDEIIKVGTEIAQKSSAKTFKVITKRADKLFPYHSDDINRRVAASVLQNTDLKVDVHNPELEIRITVRENEAFVYQESIPGLGGYPLGIAGKALMLISGGIDSPVASFLMMKRGVKLEMIHFAAPPYTSEQVLVKIKDIIHKLNVFQPAVKLYIVPFTEIQKKIYEVAGTSYAVYNEAVVHIDSVLAEVATEDELSLRAEDSIVYANQYRVDFSEVRVSLNTAESAFQEADFARASSEALTVIKKVRVEQGE